jgi:Zn-dependent peptidase ImmA (M78 family)/transcriptional regulator with XRE-family HTH domain
MTNAGPDVAYVNGAVIEWARLRSGFTYAQIGNKLRVTEDQIVAWEKNQAHPPFDKAQQLADFLGVPFGYLFLSNSPVEKIPIKDFRLLPDSYRPSANFLNLINDVLLRRDWYRDFLEDEGEKPLGFVGAFTARDDPKVVAADIRSKLHISPSLRMSSYSWSDYMTSLARHADEARILVMRSSLVGHDTSRRLSRQEFQGFAISDKFAPVVFVNTADFIAAQTFTLIHELVHIWIGQSAVSNPNPASLDAVHGTALSVARIEQFCNQVAVEVLVPRLEFTDEWEPLTDREVMIERLSSHFWVSNTVIIRRAYELNKIKREEFFTLLDQFKKKLRPRQKKGQFSYFRNIAPRVSRRVTRAVLSDLKNGRMLYRDAASIMGLSVPLVAKFSQVYR